MPRIPLVRHLCPRTTEDFSCMWAPNLHVGMPEEQRSLSPHTLTNILTKSLGKLWETLATVGPIPRHPEKAEAVARFRLTTGHNFLGVYLQWLGVAANEVCVLCGHARMDGDLLLQCTGLDEFPADDIISRYWKTRRQMVKKPSMGVG
ncbi:reverse transcriptase [Trichonephila clavipes]|nr:reverse transcriptase [Trichonephila clavipes]